MTAGIFDKRNTQILAHQIVINRIKLPKGSTNRAAIPALADCLRVEELVLHETRRMLLGNRYLRNKKNGIGRRKSIYPFF